MGEIIRKAHTHGARTQTNTGADTCKCWSCSTKNCQSDSKRQQTNSELCKTRFLIFYNFYFHYIIITTFSFRITSRRVFVSGRETEGMMMHFVEYFECTLLLRMYTNGAALAAQLASPLSLNSTQSTFGIRFSFYCALRPEHLHYSPACVERVHNCCKQHAKTTIRTLSHRPDQHIALHRL